MLVKDRPGLEALEQLESAGRGFVFGGRPPGICSQLENFLAIFKNSLWGAVVSCGHAWPHGSEDCPYCRAETRSANPDADLLPHEPPLDPVEPRDANPEPLQADVAAPAQADPVECDCGAARPDSARYGLAHLSWCSAAPAAVVVESDHESRNSITNVITAPALPTLTGKPLPTADNLPAGGNTAAPVKRKRGRPRKGEERGRESYRARQARKDRDRNPIKSSVEDPEEPQQPANDKITAGQTVVERHGYNLYPQHLREQFDEFLEAIVVDLGGRDELSTMELSLCQKLAQLEVLIGLYNVDLGVRGALTLKGKIRSTVDAYYKALDRHEKIARQLGLKRRTKQAGGTIADYLKSKQGS